MSWYFENGPESDVVVSTRIRFARNIKGIKFPSVAEKEELVNVVNLFDKKNFINGLQLLKLSDLDSLMRLSLVEKHIISKDMLNDANATILLNLDEDKCIMLNEEDHLRIQVLKPGLELEKALEDAEKLDDEINEKVEYAYSDLYGYLTTCPTNLGTGLRASVMLHLPALRMIGKIGNVVDVINKININVRGVYGEGTDAIGDLYQVSNKISLGVTNEEVINNLKSVVKKLIEQERKAREYLKSKGVSFEDKVCRDYGILAHAKKLSYSESEKLISMVKLGVEMGIINDIDAKKVNEISVVSKDATLQKYAKENLEGKELDAKRAELIQKIIKR